MTEEPKDGPAPVDADPSSAVDEAISSARRTVEDTKAVLEQTRRLLDESREMSQPFRPKPTS